MIHLDHFALFGHNHYEAASRLRAETGFGFYDGGTLGVGNANKIFPLGGSNYIEVVGIVDPYKLHDPAPQTQWLYNMMASGDHFGGLCLRVDTQQELEDLAQKRGWAISKSGRMRTSGIFLPWMSTPTPSPWPKGLPNVYFWPEMNTHPSGQPIEPSPGLTRPLGVSWVEVGGSETDLAAWLGLPLTEMPLRYSGKAPGLYAVAVKTGKGEVVIRRKSVSED